MYLLRGACQVYREADGCEKYEKLYLMLHFDRLSSLVYQSVFVTRRLLMISLVVFCSNNVITQVMLNLLVSFVVFWYALVAKPFEKDLLNVGEICNEAAVLAIAYTIFGFSDMVTSPETEIDIGWAAIAIILATMLANSLIFLKVFAHDAKKMFRRWKYQR